MTANQTSCLSYTCTTKQIIKPEKGDKKKKNTFHQISLKFALGLLTPAFYVLLCTTCCKRTSSILFFLHKPHGVACPANVIQNTKQKKKKCSMT